MSEECPIAALPLVKRPAHTPVLILHTLKLGQHTLFILSDQSIRIVNCSENTPSHAESGTHLSGEETYRLFISLWEVFKPHEGGHTHAGT